MASDIHARFDKLQQDHYALLRWRDDMVDHLAKALASQVETDNVLATQLATTRRQLEMTRRQLDKLNATARQEALQASPNRVPRAAA